MAGNLILRADNSGTGTGTIVMPASTFQNRVNWTASTGTVAVYYNPATFGTQNNFTTGNGRFSLASPSQLTAYMLVNSVTHRLAKHQHESRRHIRARQEHRRDHAHRLHSRDVYRPLRRQWRPWRHLRDRSSIGRRLFSTIDGPGTVRNLNLTHVAINGGNSQTIGALASTNHGTITNVAVAGSVGGGNSSLVGGIVGDNFGSITTSSAVGTFSGGTASLVGGLTAVNEIGSSVSKSFSGGAVSFYLGHGRRTDRQQRRFDHRLLLDGGRHRRP